jgi:hypothetical protein
LECVLAAAATAGVSAAQAAPPWSGTDVGGATPPGGVSQAGPTFTVSGGGAGLGGTSDQFFFVHQPAPAAATFRLTAQVAAFASGQAGVLMRESTAGGATFFGVFVVPGQATRVLDRRDAANGTGQNPGSAAARWVRLLAKSGGLQAYESADGVAWTLIGADLYAFSAAARIGLGVSSQNPAARSTATFQNVSLEINPPDEACAQTPIPPGPGTGLFGEYWQLAPFAGPPGIPSRPADRTRTEAVNFYGDGTWAGLEGPPVNGTDNSFAVRWTGSVTPRVSGTLFFGVEADDGVRLTVNGITLVDRWSSPPSFQYWGWQNFGYVTQLQAGVAYPLTLEYFERDVRAIASLRWSGTCQPFEIIPASQLSPSMPPVVPGTSGGPGGSSGGGGGSPGGGSAAGGGGGRDNPNGDHGGLNDACGCGALPPGPAPWPALLAAVALAALARRPRGKKS